MPGRTPRCSRDCVVVNERGLHARAAALFAGTARRFEADVRVEFSGDRASGRSVVDLLTLAATRGSTLRITAKGADAERAVAELADMVAGGFGEEA